MIYRTATQLTIAVFLALQMPLAQAQDFDPAPIIEALSLSTGGAPMADRPGWAPRKIVVMLKPADPALTAAYKSAVKAVAGAVEVTIVDRKTLQQSAKLLAEADGIIGFCNQQVLDIAGPQLRWLHSYSVGMDRCKGATEQQLEDVVFTNNKRLSGPAIAEHTVAMLLSLARQLPTYQRAQQDNRWQRNKSRSAGFGELTGKTMLVAGLGGIGTEIARRAHGLGMRIIATRNSSKTGPDFVEYVGLADELHELAGRADVVVNALPLTAQTRGLFDDTFFKAVKPGAIFLSVGRGKSTVTSALISALQGGHIYAAGLDVTDPEPLPRNSPLWSMENVIITPHVAATSDDSTTRSLTIALENLRRYIAGEAMLNVVDLRRGY